MSTITIRQGRDIKLVGAADKAIVEAPLPSKAAILPPNFLHAKHRLLVKEGDAVQVGTPLLEEKTNTDIKFVAPVSGTVAAIVRGDRRRLLQVVIDTDGKQSATALNAFLPDELLSLGRDKIIPYMLSAGLWPMMRQRPFSTIANVEDTPKSIFIHAMNTEPLAIDYDIVLKDHAEDFQNGINILNQLTEGSTYLCVAEGVVSDTLTQSKYVDLHKFKGPHPTGNVSTHIHMLDPIRKGDVVWYVEAMDVVRLGRTFTTGAYDPTNYVAVTGEGATKRHYAKTVVGASVKSLLDTMPDDHRFISGSVLAGDEVGEDGFIGYYHTQLTVIPRGGEREFLGWIMPGFNRYTFSNTFVSSFLPEKPASLDTDEKGSHRAIVLNSIYDRYNTLDVMTYFLLRAIIAGEIEEAEQLGLLECDEEDFALATFVCPSKMDVGRVIRDGLDLILREG